MFSGGGAGCRELDAADVDAPLMKRPLESLGSEIIACLGELFSPGDAQGLRETRRGTGTAGFLGGGEG